MKAFTALAVGTVCFLVAQMLPTAISNVLYALREAPRVFLPAAAVTIATLTLIIGMEYWAKRLTGFVLPSERRLLIPLPSILTLSYILEVTMLPYYAETSAIWDAAILISLLILPFVHFEERRVPLRYILGVWAAHFVWFLFIIWMHAAENGRWRDAIMGEH